MQVEVTENDINKGKRGDRYCCPVALAVRRAYGIGRPGDALVDVGEISTSIWRCGPVPSGVRRRNLFRNPPEVVAFMAAFDNKQPVRPFTFALPGLAADAREI